MRGDFCGHATRLVLSLLAVAGAVSLAGCNGSDIPIPRETITFTYKFAEQRQPADRAEASDSSGRNQQL